MSKTTANLNLFQYDVNADGNLPFHIDRALNENWEKLDAHAFLKYIQIFTAGNWTGSNKNYSLSIPADIHKRGTDPLIDLYHLSGGSYIKTENYPGNGLSVGVDPAGNITLKTGTAFAGKILVV